MERVLCLACKINNMFLNGAAYEGCEICFERYRNYSDNLPDIASVFVNSRPIVNTMHN